MQGKTRILFAILLILTFALCLPTNVRAQDPGNSQRVLKVMTRNLDAGSDFTYILTADQTNPYALPLAIAATFQEMVNSNIPARAGIIADEVLATQPDLIGLQEITTLRTGTYPGPANTVVVDGLQSLQVALANRGLHYKVIAVQSNLAVDLPALDASYNLFTAGFTDADAILARSDLLNSELSTSEVSAHHFNTDLSLPLGGGLSVPRGWISLDARLRGKDYRFVTTHLETFSPDVQAAQTEELISGPLNTNLPIVLAGDLNSDAYQPSWANGPAIQILEAASWHDTWSSLHPLDPGLTWPLFSEDPPYGPGTLYQRIDFILTHGDGITPRMVARTGVTPSSIGMWGSDHAGVFGEFVILP